MTQMVTKVDNKEEVWKLHLAGEMYRRGSIVKDKVKRGADEGPSVAMLSGRRQGWCPRRSRVVHEKELGYHTRLLDGEKGRQ